MVETSLGKDVTYNLISSNYAKLLLEFMYSEKATKFCEISTVDLSYVVVTVKSMVEISQNFVTFSEYMNSKSSFA